MTEVVVLSNSHILALKGVRSESVWLIFPGQAEDYEICEAHGEGQETVEWIRRRGWAAGQEPEKDGAYGQQKPPAAHIAVMQAAHCYTQIGRQKQKGDYEAKTGRHPHGQLVEKQGGNAIDKANEEHEPPEFGS